MNSELFLRSMINRIQQLEPDLETSRPPRFAAWGEADFEKMLEQNSGGKGHLKTAFWIAKKALDTGSSEKMNDAALISASYILTAWELAQQKIAKLKRSKGGRTTGARQTAKAEEEWRPWIKKFQNKIDGGVKPAIARRAIKSEMTKTCFTLASTGDYPSESALKKWLKPKK